MKKLLGLLVFFFAITIFLSASNLADSVYAATEFGPYDLVVSPDGSDENAGTLASPLKTVAAAKEKLKAVKESVEGRVTVYLRGGRYEFDDVLRFTSDDLPNVTYRAYEGEEVVFSGAKAISGFTEETVNGIRMFTKTLDPGTQPTKFKSLFSESEALDVARYPKTGYFTVKATAPEDDLWTDETTQWDLTLGQRSFYADKNDLIDFTDYENVQVRILHYWHDELMFLTGLDRNSGKVSLSRPSSMRIRDIDRYYFENVFEALSEPGEWYLNQKTNKLYYVPKEGENAETIVLYASEQERLIDINGVDGLTFEGIRFTQTDWEVPDPKETDWDQDWRIQYDIDALQAAYDVRGVVTTKYTKNTRFVGCEFINLGADGIKMMHGTQNCIVENCLFRHIAATAVYAGAANCQPDDPDCVKNITVRNCDVSGYGRKFYCAIGIHITFCDGAELTHNEISDGYYTGISVGWTWGYTYHLTRNIKITDNLIYNIGQGWLSDMGGIYMLGIQPGTVISGNVIHNVAADPGEGGYGGWGIYLDEGSSRMTVENNLVFCCGSQGFNIHYGEGNIIRNNISALNGEGQVSVGSRDTETHATAFYYDNIFVSRNGEPIYAYMSNVSHFYENGNLLWDLSNGEPSFALDYGLSVLTLSDAKRQGFLHNPTVADPLFNDIENYDFTLREDSPAFALNFKSWDYGKAGTLKETTIGFSTPGGQTAYNAHVTAVAPVTYPASVATILKIVLIALACLVVLFWLVFIFTKIKPRYVIAFLASLIAVGAGVLLYYYFVHWNVVIYVVGLVVISFAVGVLPGTISYLRKRSLLKALFFGAMWTLIVAAVFFGLTLLLNNLLNLGAGLAISCSLLTALVFLLVHTVRFIKCKSL